MSYTNDPWDDATAAGERSGMFFGRMDVNAQFVVLLKGQGKVPFNPGIHSIDDRRTEIFLSLNPIDEMGMTRAIERNLIAQSKEWAGIVWASLRTLGLSNARELQGKYARVELVKTGRTWEKNGETVEGTTFKFTALYTSKEECVAAWRADRGGPQQADEDIPFDAPANGAVEDNERKTALAFLPAVVNMAGGDIGKLATILASTSPINKYFTVTSPEVVAEFQKVTA